MSVRNANLLCLLCAIIWGGGFIATASALESFAPFGMLVIRFIGAALISWLPVWFLKGKVTRKSLMRGTLSGLFLYLAFASQTIGLDLTETGMNAFLTAVNVVMVPYIAWMVFHKRPSVKALQASLLCFAGIGFLSLSSGSFVFRIGDWFSLLCAFFFACQIVALNGLESENPMVVNAIQISVAAILSVPFGLWENKWPASISLQTAFSLFYSIVLATFVCYMLQTTAQKYTDPSSASVLLSTESLWANIFGFLILHEAKSPAMILGGLLIFASILLVEAKPKEGRERRSFKDLNPIKKT